MASEPPVCRHLIACREIAPEADSDGVTLKDLIHAIVRLPGEPFPCVRETMALYALLTNGRGEHDFTLEMTCFDATGEWLVRRSGPVRRDLGQDPTQVFGFPIPLVNVRFPQAGHYTFHLLGNGRAIAAETVVVR